MSDAFWHSEDLLEETVHGDASAIDPSQPGFSSLLPLLQDELRGNSRPGVLAAYHAGLSEHLAQARATFEALPMTDEVRAEALPALQVTLIMFHQMDQVLALVAEHLETTETEPLEAATEQLQALHAVMLKLAS